HQHRRHQWRWRDGPDQLASQRREVTMRAGRACFAEWSALLAILAIDASAQAHAETTINVAGDCNFVVVEASLVLSDDFQFSNDCADPKWIREEYTRVFGAAGVPPLML